jgi:hypothetical protein
VKMGMSHVGGYRLRRGDGLEVCHRLPFLGSGGFLGGFNSEFARDVALLVRDEKPGAGPSSLVCCLVCKRYVGSIAAWRWRQHFLLILGWRSSGRLFLDSQKIPLYN